jgi:hypothetical protein
MANKIVLLDTSLLIQEFWDSDKVLQAKREAYLTKEDIRCLLKVQPVAFVVANPGNLLKWINPSDCYSLWKNQAEPHMANDLEQIYIDNFPDQYAFIASKWSSSSQVPIILLEQIH